MLLQSEHLLAQSGLKCDAVGDPQAEAAVKSTRRHLTLGAATRCREESSEVLTHKRELPSAIRGFLVIIFDDVAQWHTLITFLDVFVSTLAVLLPWPSTTNSTS